MRPTANPLLHIDRLSVDFRTPRGTLQALRNVSLTVPKGRIVGVVGESGCGKSTLISSILRLLAPNAQVAGGSIAFHGQDLLGLSEKLMRALRGERISMIFQDPMTALNPVISIGQQMIDIQYRRSGGTADKRRRATAMLARVGIPDPESRLSAHAHQFSGGMRQRIAIAMALMMEPDLLIADEPTTALDATLEVQIIQLLRDLQQDMGCSILFVSHHLGVIAELCHDVVVMYAGEVVEEGPVREIFHTPAHPYTRLLLDCDPGRIHEKTRTLPTIPGDVPDLVTLPDGCIFRDRCPDAQPRCAVDVPVPHRAPSGQFARCHLLAPGVG